MRNEFKLETPRLTLREIRMEDGDAILSAMSCPDIHSMHSDGFKTIEDVNDYISVLEKEYENKKFRTLAVAEKISDLLVGAITIDAHKFFPRAELSYWTAIPHRSKGYATEAVKAVIEYCIMTLNFGRVQATHHVENAASGRVLEKAGMVCEGTLRRYFEFNGFATDEKMYSAIRSDITEKPK